MKILNDFSDYTTEELEEELKRRKPCKAKERVAHIQKLAYNHATALTILRTIKRWRTEDEQENKQ